MQVIEFRHIYFQKVTSFWTQKGLGLITWFICHVIDVHIRCEIGILGFERRTTSPISPRKRTQLTRSSAVTGSPLVLLATTILPRRSRMSLRLVVKARMAMISLATVMSN